MTNFRYDMIGASLSGVNKHPQQDMKDLGFNVIKSECFSVGDCWWFRVDNENDISVIPNYLDRRDVFKFSDEYSHEEMQEITKNHYRDNVEIEKILPKIKTAIFKIDGEEVFRCNLKECEQ